jgi:hypothetical protein
MKDLINWFEIPAIKIERAAKFYGKLLNLDLKVVDCGSEKYVFFPEKGVTVPGMISQAEGFNPSENGVILYFNAANKLDELISRTVEAGGEVVMNKCQIEAEGRGCFALIKDTEGNRIGLYAA